VAGDLWNQLVDFRVVAGDLWNQLVQPFICGLRHGIEYKVFFIGNELIYFVRTFITKESKDTACLYGDENEDEKNVLKFAKKVYDSLPPIYFNGIESPSLLTRVDIGCCYNETYFVTEIEFVPSLFLPDVNKISDIKIDQLLGDQIIKIAEYKNNENEDKITKTKAIFIFIILTILIIVLVTFSTLLLLQVWKI
jgi:hypothetical protein